MALSNSLNWDGGFGGGNGQDDGGGGGLGAGGAIFVQDGATLSINGGSISGGSVTKGMGADGRNNGSAFGAGIFLQGNQNLVFAPAAGQTTVISDVIADETGSNGGGVGATGKGSLTLNGPGTLDLTASNSFSGGVTIDQGTLEIGNSAALNFNNVNFAAMGGGTLLIDASIGNSGFAAIFANINGFDSSASFDFAGFDPVTTHATFSDSFGNALIVTNGTRTDVLDFANSLDFTGHTFYVAPDDLGGSIVSLRAHAPPSLTDVPAFIVHTTGALQQDLVPNALVADPDSATLASATISLGSSYLAGDVLMSDEVSAGITQNYANGVLTLSGVSSLANYQEAIESVTYSTTAADPTGGGADPSREVTFTLNDGNSSNNLSAPVTENVFFAGTPPTVTAGTATLTGGVEGATPTTLSATFSDTNMGAPTSDFSGTIAWGDGQTTTFDSSAVSGSNGSYTVSGSHQYAEEGTYNATVTINDAGGSSASESGTATVGDAALTQGTATLTGGVMATMLSATFSDANTGAPTSDFSGTIAWGDGQTTIFDSTAVSGSNGSYTVDGSHQYATEGSYTATVTINDEGGSATTESGTASIASSNLPVVAAVASTVNASASETFTPAQLFSASEAEGLPILSYEVEDASIGSSQGFWVLNGAVLPNGQTTTLTAAQLSQLSFVAGSASTPVSDTLEVAASDAAGFGAVHHLHGHRVGPRIDAGADCHGSERAGSPQPDADAREPVFRHGVWR